MADKVTYKSDENDDSRTRGSSQFEQIRGKINRNSHFFLGQGTVPTSNTAVQLGTDDEIRSRLAKGRSGDAMSVSDALLPQEISAVFGDERAVPFPRALDSNRRPDVPMSSAPDMTSRVGPGVPRIITSPRVDPLQARKEDADLFEGVVRQQDAIRAMMQDTGAPIYREPPQYPVMDAGMVQRDKEASKRQQDLMRPVRDAEGNEIDMKTRPKVQANDTPVEPPKVGRPKSATTPAPKKDVGRPKKETAPKKAVGRPKKETAPKKAVGRPKKNK